MFYIIGPERSAEALARKTGLRNNEWRLVDRERKAVKPAATDIVLSTSDAMRLPNGEYGRIEAAVTGKSLPIP